MKCPYCEKEAKIKEVVKYNLEAYGRSVKARTQCCNSIIKVWPVITFKCCEVEDQTGRDDWGE